MTLNIYWNGHINDKNPNWVNLDDTDKKFLIPRDLLSSVGLPSLLMISHIGFVTEESIPHIVARLRMVDQEMVDKLSSHLGATRGVTLSEYLQVFTGVTSNWPTATKSEFLKHIGRDIPELTQAGIKKLQKVKRANVAA